MNRFVYGFYALLVSTLLFQNCAKNSFTPEQQSKELSSTNVQGQGSGGLNNPIQPDQATQPGSSTVTATSSGTTTSTTSTTATSTTSNSNTTTVTLTSTSTTSTTQTATTTASNTNTNTGTSTVTNWVCPTSGPYADSSLATYLQKSFKIIGIYGMYQGRFAETDGYNYWNKQSDGFENLHYYMQTQDAGQQAVQGYYTNIPTSPTGVASYHAFINAVYSYNWKIVPDSSIGDTGLAYWSGITAGTVSSPSGENSQTATGSNNPVILSVQTLSYMYQSFFESLCDNNAANANKRVLMIRRMVFINALRGGKYFVDRGIENPGIYALQTYYRDMINSTYLAIKDLNSVAAMSTAAESVYQSKISTY